MAIISITQQAIGEVYTPSVRAYEPPGDPRYPYHEHTVRVTRRGRMCFDSRKINFSNQFSGQLVGIREVD